LEKRATPMGESGGREQRTITGLEGKGKGGPYGGDAGRFVKKKKINIKEGKAKKGP